MVRLAAILIGIGALITSGCASSQAVPRPFPGAAIPPTALPAPSSQAEEPTVRNPTPDWSTSLVATALSFRGVPYRNGGTDPTGFDCSGFVRYVFAQYGQQLPREVQAQFRIGREIDREHIEPGDLVFFQTVSPGASHVGIALGHGEFVHAPSSRGVVRTERYTIDYWAKRWVGAKRIAVNRTAENSE